MSPIKKSSITIGRDGFRYRIDISIEKHKDKDKYPEGVKAIFKLIRLDINNDGETELVILIDNHKPFGFHSHEKLPENQDYRMTLNTDNWNEAWDFFQTKCREILK